MASLEARPATRTPLTTSLLWLEAVLAVERLRRRGRPPHWLQIAYFVYGWVIVALALAARE